MCLPVLFLKWALLESIVSGFSLLSVIGVVFSVILCFRDVFLLIMSFEAHGVIIGVVLMFLILTDLLTIPPFFDLTALLLISWQFLEFNLLNLYLPVAIDLLYFWNKSHRLTCSMFLIFLLIFYFFVKRLTYLSIFKDFILHS